MPLFDDIIIGTQRPRREFRRRGVAAEERESLVVFLLSVCMCVCACVHDYNNNIEYTNTVATIL